jgi:hypothetical protein
MSRPSQSLLALLETIFTAAMFYTCWPAVKWCVNEYGRAGVAILAPISTFVFYWSRLLFTRNAKQRKDDAYKFACAATKVCAVLSLVALVATGSSQLSKFFIFMLLWYFAEMVTRQLSRRLPHQHHLQ